MKLRMQFYFLCLLLLLIALLCSACGMKSNITNDDPEVLQTDSLQYMIKTPFYQIYEKGLQEYSYKIESGGKVYAEGVKQGTEPKIEVIGNGVLKLSLGFGTNALSVRYFDVFRDRTSEEFSPNSIYADFTDEKMNECFIAYFDVLPDSEKVLLRIKDVFNGGLSTEIDRGFVSETCNRLVFLNENEIYLDYDVFADGYSSDDLKAGNPIEYKNIRETVKFR